MPAQRSSAGREVHAGKHCLPAGGGQLRSDAICRFPIDFVGGADFCWASGCKRCRSFGCTSLCLDREPTQCIVGHRERELFGLAKLLARSERKELAAGYACRLWRQPKSGFAP